jgi:hypothetical protein
MSKAMQSLKGYYIYKIAIKWLEHVSLLVIAQLQFTMVSSIGKPKATDVQ